MKMEELVNLSYEEKIYGYVEQDGSYEEYMFQKTPENIANFVGSRPMADSITLTDPLDRLILNTFGKAAPGGCQAAPAPHPVWRGRAEAFLLPNHGGSRGILYAARSCWRRYGFRVDFLCKLWYWLCSPKTGGEKHEKT